nr:unnamed protein product [Leishmania braziliensis]
MSSSSGLKLPARSLEVAKQSSLTASSAPAASSGTPVESAEVYENICGICFTDIHPVDNPRGRLNSCGHLFCSHCIREWAKNTNVCPNCKARFTRIYTAHADSGKEQETKVRKRNYVAWESSYYDEEDDDVAHEEALLDSVRCDVCQQSHNAARMIFCDRRQCVYVAHLDCLSLAERPVTFLCAACSKLREKDDHVPLTESFSGTSLPDASSEPPVPLTPVAAGPALAQCTAVACAAATAAVVAQKQTTVSLVDTGGSSCNAELPTRASFSSAPTFTMMAAPVPRVVRLADNPTAEHHGNSRRSSSTASSRRTESSTVPRVAVDFSKPHLHLMSSATTASPRNSRRPSAPPPTGNATAADDNYYFLAPTSHAVAAMIELNRIKQARAAEAQTRHQHARSRAERLQAVYRAPQSDVLPSGARKRTHRTAADEITAELESAEKEFGDPQQRRLMEERMVRKWATDILPVLRRRRYIEGDTTTSESDLWAQAVTQARSMVREKLVARGESLRRRREQLVRAEAQREAAALAKLARIIAQHREHPPRLV